MNCKKFNVGNKTAESETKITIPTSEKIGAVCEIEIKPPEKKEFVETKSNKIKKKPPFVAIFCAVFCLAAIFGYTMPMPKELEKLLISLSAAVTEPCAKSTVLIFEAEPEKAEQTVPSSPLPAASDSMA